MRFAIPIPKSRRRLPVLGRMSLGDSVMKAVREHRLIHAVLAAATACAGLAHAQEVTPVEVPPDCPIMYVDANCGNDSNPGSASAPFKTLRHAISQAALVGGPTTVVLMPGQYSTQGPVVMPPDVSLMGTNVLNTRIVDESLTFEPTAVGDYDEVVIENISFSGGIANTTVLVRIQNSLDRQIASNPTFSNCFFVDCVGTSVQMFSRSDGVHSPLMDFEDADTNGLVEHRPKFINCTFANNRYGVVDTSTFGFGENEAGFLNCLFWNAGLGANQFDLVGVDRDDLLLSGTSQLSNAWHLADPGGPPPAAGTLKPGRKAPGPEHRVFDPLNLPPGGSTVFLARTTLVSAFGDYRLAPEDKPDNAAVNKGVIQFSPAWVNGTRGQRFFPCGQDVWDTDGEGYGNPRIVENKVDIGADEMGMLIVAGYANGTTRIRQPNSGNIQLTFWLARPFVGDAQPLLDFSVFSIRDSNCSNWVQWWPSFVPGIMASHAIAPLSTPFGTLLLSPNPAEFIETARQGSTPDRFTPLTFSFPAPVQEMQVSQQALSIDQGGSLNLLTNLQTYFVPPPLP
jgi:hypothetical protein